MSFVDVLFPSSPSYGSKTGPRFRTVVINFDGDEDGGNEQRIQKRERARWDAELTISKLSLTQSQSLQRFFLNRRGKAQGFLLNDFNDNSATGQHLGYGDGTEQTFQLLKHYEDLISFAITDVDTGSNYFEIDNDYRFMYQVDEFFRVGESTGNDKWYSLSAVSLESGKTRLTTNESITDATVDGFIYPQYSRIIQKPLISSVKIYQNAVEEPSGNITHDGLGNVTFTTNNGETITVDYSFYMPVRLGSDENLLARIRPNTNTPVNLSFKGLYLKAA